MSLPSFLSRLFGWRKPKERTSFGGVTIVNGFQLRPIILTMGKLGGHFNTITMLDSREHETGVVFNKLPLTLGGYEAYSEVTKETELTPLRMESAKSKYKATHKESIRAITYELPELEFHDRVIISRPITDEAEVNEYADSYTRCNIFANFSSLAAYHHAAFNIDREKLDYSNIILATLPDSEIKCVDITLNNSAELLDSGMVVRFTRIAKDGSEVHLENCAWSHNAFILRSRIRVFLPFATYDHDFYEYIITIEKFNKNKDIKASILIEAEYLDSAQLRVGLQ